MLKKWYFIGDDKLESLASLKSKNELIGEIGIITISIQKCNWWFRKTKPKGRKAKTIEN